MLQVTNNMFHFFERIDSPLFVCDADRTGYHVGDYLTRCGMDFSGYLSPKIRREKTDLRGKTVFRFESFMKKREDVPQRIFLCSSNYKEMLVLLKKATKRNREETLCLIPEFDDLIDGRPKYNINRALGYFRRKIYKGEIPLFIPNNCIAGLLYEALGMPLSSPFINTRLWTDEYLKVCRDPETYLRSSLEDFHWQWDYFQQKSVPAARLHDVTIWFPHENIYNESVFPVLADRFESLKPARMRAPFLLLDDTATGSTFMQRKAFAEMPFRRLYVTRKSSIRTPLCRELLLETPAFYVRNIPMEDYFDFLDYLMNYEFYE